MIVASSKPFQEIKQMLSGFKKVCVLGCGSCVTICHTGGEKQVAELAAQIRLSAKLEGRQIEVIEDSTLRQCEWEFIDDIKEIIKDCDAVLSIACGVGVQYMAERFPKIRIFPGVNTTFMGGPTEQGIFWERCAGCGNCILATTGGLCPVSRCAKSLLNGPCGGSQNGKCEVSQETPCVWHQIYDQLDTQQLLATMEPIVPPKDWSTGMENHPRKMILEHLVMKKQ
ncbi:MAG: methylenetetrahydrofolate reductase C-terminal domain-containing protein [Candidatus Brocadiaceae bacterium]|nr:methylenetetrahydrofolate reductase C-terminal domain-containing protein [Candidatus Brocadiaceae bacterium]